MTPASTRRSSGTPSATSAAPMPHSPPMPSPASRRHRISCHSWLVSAHRAVPQAYRAMVANSARLRPMRSAIQPNSTPPAAQVTSSIEVSAPIQNTTAWCAAGEPGGRCSSTGRQLGATKLNSSASKTSKPQPAQPAAITSQW